MHGPIETLAIGLLRTTLVTAAAAVLAMALLSALRVRSPRAHRCVWVLVIAQGWLFSPYTFRIEVERPSAPPAVATTATETHMLNATVRAPVRPAREPVDAFDVGTIPQRAVVAAWALGVVAVPLAGVLRYARLLRAGRLSRSADDPVWVEEWERARGESRLASTADLRVTRALGPFVYWAPKGFFVVVPRGLWSRLTSRDRLVILRHELAHCVRGDLWKNTAACVLALPQWFNPLVWLAVQRFEEAGEWACDEQVARATGENSTEYARSLLRVADYGAAVPSGALGVTGGQLTRRVQRLLHLPDKEAREMRGIILPLLLAAIGLLQAVQIERVAAHEPAADGAVSPPRAENRTAPGGLKWSFDEPYVIEPPDILLINMANGAPRSSHKIQRFDGLLIRATGVIEDQPIADVYFVDDKGNIDLGPTYGKVTVGGVKLSEVERTVQRHLAEDYPQANATVSLEVTETTNQIVGEHLVGPDGRINLREYGQVDVTGLTLPQAKKRIENALSMALVDPKVTVDVFASNSKRCYIITKSARGDNVVTMPITGNETVLDAIAMIGGAEAPQGPKVWVARPSKVGKGDEQVLPVDILAITSGKSDATNYRLYPGDRLFVDHGDAATTEVQLSVLNDLKKNLRNVEVLEAGDRVVGDSQLLEGIVGVLTNNGLADVIATSTVVTRDGQRSTVRSVGDEAEKASAVEIELGNRRIDNQVVFEARADVKIGENKSHIEMAFALTAGQSCLVRLGADGTTSAYQSAPADDLYLLVTRPAETAAAAKPVAPARY